MRRDGVENKDLRKIWIERGGERESRVRGLRERLDTRDLRHQRYRLGLKMGHSAHCCVLLHGAISDLDS